ncbi:SurA N-terminal domain-containing protein [Planotetraspora sp. A-T 1434]|uniref:SurA N-terminal domain-containing protein n=1 Tax=Planotetraspora sp. A-T 1434 TaxID=2979219 RepID=UPI0021BDF92E|nr:SurA N-terminal domain-containing protein [Planotetraspora sp. A-T 1434]MCT9931595.1 SurA N-terminal domain-containing protein [Planotetraspora sp. A-T 1434]
MKSYRVRVAAAVVAAGVALSACSPMQAGAAAIVGKDRITSSDLNAEIQAYRKDLAANKIPEDQLGLHMSVPQLVLLNMANGRQFAEFGRQKGITVTETEIEQGKRAIVEGQGGQASMDQILLANGIPLSEGNNAIRALVIRQKLMVQLGAGNDQQSQQAASLKVAQEADTAVPVTYSPRYGKFDPQQGFVADDRFGAVAPAAPAAPAAPPAGAPPA